MGEWTIGAVLDAIAEAVPDRLMTVCGTRRSTFGESAERTRRLANYLAGQGLGAHRERDDLANWECGQDRVALIMHNDLYPDMVIGSLKARTVPVNVNYNYAPREVAELLEYLQPRAVIYHRSFGPKFADVLPPAAADLMISVDDESSAPQLQGAISLEDALAQGDTNHDIAASPDDVMMVCTGGTTGRPKGVMWRQSDTYVVSMNGADHESVDEIHAKLGFEGAPWFAVSPLMHAAGMWTAFAGLLNGLPIVLYDKTRFDPCAVLETAEREKVGMMTMVGDAYAGTAGRGTAQRFLRPVVDVRDRHRRSGDQPETPTGASRIAAADHLDQRLRILGDRATSASAAASTETRRTHSSCAKARWSCRRTTAVSCNRGSRRSASSPAPDASRSATSTTRPPPARRFPSSRGSVW